MFFFKNSTFSINVFDSPVYDFKQELYLSNFFTIVGHCSGNISL